MTVKPRLMASGLCHLFLGGLFAGLMTLSQSTQAQDAVNLTWDPDTTGLVTQYRVWYGSQSGIYTNSILYGNVNDVELDGLQGGVTYYFAVQCMDQQGDVSLLSNEASYSAPVLEPVQIQMLTFPGTTTLYLYGNVNPPGYWELDSSPDLINWTIMDWDTSGSMGYSIDMSQAPQLFFRVLRK